MSRAVIIQSLFEEVFGKIAVGYHRTDAKGLDALASGQSFHLNQISHGRIFGDGIYMTYDLQSQSHLEMFVYGDYIIKVKVNLEKYLILDYDVMKRVYRVSTIGEQLEQVFRLPRQLWNRILTNNMIQKIKNYDSPFSRYTYTEDLAENFISEPTSNRWLRSNARGMVVKADPNKAEGNLIVAFDPRSVTPIGWTRAPNPQSTLHAEFEPVSSIAKETLNPPLTVPGGNYVERLIRAPLKSFARQLKNTDFPFGLIKFETHKTDTSKAMITIVSYSEESNKDNDMILNMVRKIFIPFGWQISNKVHSAKLYRTTYELYIRLYSPKHVKLPYIVMNSNE